MTSKQVINELEFAKAMCQFDPTTGEVGFRSEEDRRQYEAFDVAAEALRFVQWIAEEIFLENANDAFTEIACRKLAKLGIIKLDGDEWVLEDNQ